MDILNIDHELSLLKENCLVPITKKKLNKDEYYVEVIITPPTAEQSLLKKEVNFLIHVPDNYPYTPPKLYCKTPFSFPHICDGRDILEDVIGTAWVPQMKLTAIVFKLDNFILEFLKHLKQGNLVLVGTYYLGEKYDLSLLESLPVYLRKVKEKININGKDTEIPKVLIISDQFFCLFDQEKWAKNNIQLSFWSNIRSLVTIRKMVNGNTFYFFWKQRNNKKNFEMVLAIDTANDVLDLLLDKMQKFGINYKITKQNLQRKEGVLPSIDIEAVEQRITALEEYTQTNPDMDLVRKMMDLYEKAVEYYSATNNPKYEYYTQKLHYTLKSPRMSEFLDSSREKEINEIKAANQSKNEEENKN